MSDFGKFTGNTIGEAAAFAAGLAIGPLLEPYVQELKNETWAHTPSLPLDPDVMAQGVAEHKLTLATGQSEAALTGISNSAFASLVTVMKKSPAVAEGVRLIRRGQLAPSEFLTVLQRAGLEDEFITAYQKAAVNGLAPWEAPLDPSVLAVGAVRSTVDSQDLLVVDLDTSGSNVARYTPAALDIIAEAAANGVDKERLRVMVGNVGLPMGSEAAARAEFRGIITKGAFYQAILEGDTRPEWADSIYEFSRQIITAHDYVELHLRGYISQQQMYDGTALHGMSTDDTDRLFQVLGRPLTVHQITTGLARGGTFQPIPGELTDPYEASVHESNIKPSYYDLAIANRYSYPSLFQLNALVKANAITADVAADWATKDGLAPEVVTALHTFWAGEQSSTTGGATTKPKQFTYSQIHAAWSHGLFTDADALTELEAIGYPAARAQTLLDTWKRQSTASSA